MLREDTKAKLKDYYLPDGLEHVKTRIANLPQTLQDLAVQLVPNNNRRYDHDAYQALLADIAALSTAEREQIFAAFSPKLGSLVTEMWDMWQQQPYTHHDYGKPYRAAVGKFRKQGLLALDVD